MRVLLVDDEPSIRKTTSLAVETMGHEVVGVANGARALKAVEETSFDVCFLDLRLGAEDGLEVLGKLLAASPALAVVMFTAYANIATAVEAMRRGAFDFIPKPFTPDPNSRRPRQSRQDALAGVALAAAGIAAGRRSARGES